MPTGKGPLRIAIEDFISGQTIGDKVNQWIRDGATKIVHGLNSDVIKALEHLRKTQTTSNFDPYESVIPVDMGIGGTLLMVLGLVFSVIFSFGNALTGPFGNLVTQMVESGVHSQKISMPAFLNLLRMYPDEAARFIDETDFQGFNVERVQAMFLAGNQEINIGALIALKLRNLISLDEYHQRALKLGYDELRSENLLNVAMVIPTPQDLIYLAVKEAFDDKLSSQFQHDEGLPGEFVEWASKQGLGDEWTKRYWRAHWNLPSPQQVFEMLQRLRPGTTANTVSSDDVDQYLKMADYSPFWRSRLREIAYSPFTRVDVRRMFKTGTLTVEQVKEAYLDLGYNDDKAQKLTEFTIAYEAEEETGIVRSSVTAAYDAGMIDRAKAEEMLSAGGYDEITRAFYLDSIDFNHSLDVKKIKLDNIHKRYVNGLTDESTVNGEINQLALPAERVTAMLELWGTERENQTTLLTITQMEVLLERKIVTEGDYTRIAKQRGYTDESIKWTLTRIAGEAADKAQNDAEKAQADSERLNKSTAASQYQKDKAAIDVLIAQARAQITDIDVALHGELANDDIIALMAQKDQLKIFITEQNVLKAQLKFNMLPGTTTIEA